MKSPPSHAFKGVCIVVGGLLWTAALFVHAQAAWLRWLCRVVAVLGVRALHPWQTGRWHNGSPYMLCAILHTYSGHAVNGVALGVAFVVIVCDRLQCCAVEVMQTAAVPQASKGDKQGHLLLTVAAHAMLVCCSEVLPLMLDPKQWFSWVTVTLPL